MRACVHACQPMRARTPLHADLQHHTAALQHATHTTPHTTTAGRTQVEELVADALARQRARPAPQQARDQRRVGDQHDVLPTQAEAADAAVAVGPLKRLQVVVGAQQVGDVSCPGHAQQDAAQRSSSGMPWLLQQCMPVCCCTPARMHACTAAQRRAPAHATAGAPAARTQHAVSGRPRDLVEVELGAKQVVSQQVHIEANLLARAQRHGGGSGCVRAHAPTAAAARRACLLVLWHAVAGSEPAGQCRGGAGACRGARSRRRGRGCERFGLLSRCTSGVLIQLAVGVQKMLAAGGGRLCGSGVRHRTRLTQRPSNRSIVLRETSTTTFTAPSRIAHSSLQPWRPRQCRRRRCRRRCPPPSCQATQPQVCTAVCAASPPAGDSRRRTRRMRGARPAAQRRMLIATRACMPALCTGGGGDGAAAAGGAAQRREPAAAGLPV